MRYLILIDLEGASGVYNQQQCTTGTKQWYKAKKYLTDNVNAVIKGIYSIDNSAKIVVRDLHNQGYNIHCNYLPRTVRYIGGPYHKPIMWFGDLGNFDLAFMIGIHARSGTLGFQPHTQSLDFSEVKINNKPICEVEFTASLITENISPPYPIGFVSGENIAIEQVKESLPWVVSVQIQKDKPNNDFIKRIALENESISQKARMTIKNRSKFQLFQFDFPLKVEISYHDSYLVKKVAKRWKMTLEDDHQTFMFVVSDTKAFIQRVVEIMYLTPKTKFFIPLTPLLRPLYRLLAL